MWRQCFMNKRLFVFIISLKYTCFITTNLIFFILCCQKENKSVFLMDCVMFYTRKLLTVDNIIYSAYKKNRVTLKLHTAYILRWNRRKNFNITSFHIFDFLVLRYNFSVNYKQVSEWFICKPNTEFKCGLTD